MRNKVLTGICIFFGTILLFAILFYIRATQPWIQARREAQEIAEEYADLDEVEEFFWYTREKSYFSLVGENTKKEKIIVIIPESGEKVSVLKQKDGLTKKKAFAQVAEAFPTVQITKAALGMHENKAVWEVTGTTDRGYIDYFLLDFHTGKWVKVIENV